MSPACLCAACPAQVSLTSKRAAKSSAAGEGVSWISGWGSDAQVKCYQASANAARLGRLRDTQKECSADLGRDFSSLWGAVPGECNPFLTGSLPQGVELCAVGFLPYGSQRGHTVRLCWGGCAFSKDALSTPWSHPVKKHPPGNMGVAL